MWIYKEIKKYFSWKNGCVVTVIHWITSLHRVFYFTSSDDSGTQELFFLLLSVCICLQLTLTCTQQSMSVSETSTMLRSCVNAPFLFTDSSFCVSFAHSDCHSNTNASSHVFRCPNRCFRFPVGTFKPLHKHFQDISLSRKRNAHPPVWDKLNMLDTDHQLVVKWGSNRNMTALSFQHTG